MGNPTLAASILRFPKQCLSHSKNSIERISPGHCAVQRNVSDFSPYSCQRLDAASQQDPSLSQTHRRYTHKHNSSSDLLARNYSVILYFLNPDKKGSVKGFHQLDGRSNYNQTAFAIKRFGSPHTPKQTEATPNSISTYFKKFLLFKSFDM